MKNLGTYLLIITLFCFNSLICHGQVDQDQHDVMFTIPEIVLLDIEPNNTSITLTLDQPTDAGAPVTTSTNGTNNTKWLNYSSCISPSTTPRTISVQITNGTIPDGLNLTLQASNVSGIGQGVLGTPSGLITPSNTPQILISGIGGAFTGTGSNNGHQLTYSLSIDNYNLLDANNSATIEITYTITE